jgi:hypothetical protein
MFDQLSARLTEAVRQVTGRGRITEDNVRETARAIRMALLEADVALPVAKGFVERVRERALGQDVAKSLNPGQAFVKIVHDELVGVLGGDASPISQHGHPVVRRNPDDELIIQKAKVISAIKKRGSSTGRRAKNSPNEKIKRPPTLNNCSSKDAD